MYDFAFDAKNIARELRRSDFHGNPGLAQPAAKAALVSYAVRHAAGGFNSLVFDTHTKNGKVVYDTALLSQDLVLRKLRHNIKQLTRVRQSDRDETIMSLRSLLVDCSGIRIYKLDIKSFYESIDRSHIESKLCRDLGFPASSLYVFRSFSSQLQSKQISGLPRGLAISETLTEYVMRPFDRAVQQLDSVYYYGRYVDDIVILTTGKENKNDFMRELRSLLAPGLSFNQGKCQVIEITKGRVHDQNVTAPIAGSFDFLGYRFRVFERTKSGKTVRRDVHLDISPKKVQRMKTRLVLSLRRYVLNDNFSELIDRLKILTGNYSIYDYDTGVRRKIGIGTNYRLINKDQSVSLPELDDFIHKIILGTQGNLCTGLCAKLDNTMKRRLLKFRFSHAFNPKTYHHLNAARVATSIDCWKHV
jgi:hypothetical protein